MIVDGNGRDTQPNLGTHAWMAMLPAVPPCLKGDADGDGAVTIGGAAMIVDVLLAQDGRLLRSFPMG